MKKTLFFVVIVLALFCFISCDHLSSVKYDVSGSNPVDSLNGKITSDGTSISLVFPAFPGAASRDADPDVNENQHFHVTLIAEPDFIESKEGCAGETVTFENLTPGDYTLKCEAWDDDSGLRFTGTQDVTVQAGNNEVELVMDFVTEDEHIKLEMTDDGVKVTIKNIDFGAANSISVFDYTSASDVVSPYFGFELDDEKASQISAAGDSYSFIWPFAPMKVDGQNRNYYVFQYQHVDSATGALVQELVCCPRVGNKYSLNLSNYSRILCKYYTDTELLQRKVHFDNISLNTLRWTVTDAVPLEKIGTFRAILETWAGDFVSGGNLAFVTSEKVLVNKSGDLGYEAGYFRDLAQGNDVNLLSYSSRSAAEVNSIIEDSAYNQQITPNLRWQFSMNGIENGWFQLPPIKKCFHSEQILEKTQDGILSAEIRDNIIYLKVNVPSETSYLTILEEGTDYSYAFTSKDPNGILTCCGRTVEIPWAFDLPDNGYAAFKVCCTSGSSYTYQENSICLFGDDLTGGIFSHAFLDYGGEPVFGRDIIINDTDFKISMPKGKVAANYMLDFQNSGCVLADSSIVYSLCFTDTDYNMDLRFNLSGNIPAETVQLFDGAVKYDIRSSESIYWSNNDENGGKTSFGPTQNHPSDYMYSLMHLQNNPAFKTTGALAYRLKFTGMYIDTGLADSWLGEYRIALWDQGEYTQMHTYPPAVQTTRAAAGTKVGISMPTDSLQRWNVDGANMKTSLEHDGYTVDLRYAGDNDVNLQIEQIEGMINGGCNVLIVAAVDGWNLSDCLAGAKNAGVKVIAYDRLIANTDAVSYYTTFNTWNVGVLQGEYVKTSLDLDNAAGPFYIEFFTGDKGDANVTQFFGGAMSVLEPYLNSGKLICLSRQTIIEACATSGWSSDNAQSRMVDLIGENGYAPAGQKLDAVLCSNDSTAQGVIAALKEVGYTAGNMPVVTGQDCDRPNAKMIKDGEQSMSVFKDTRTLAAKAVEMAESILQGNGVLVNDVSTYNNGTGCIPTLLVDPVCCDVSNYHELLIDSGYYSEFDLQ